MAFLLFALNFVAPSASVLTANDAIPKRTIVYNRLSSTHHKVENLHFLFEQSAMAIYIWHYSLRMAVFTFRSHIASLKILFRIWRSLRPHFQLLANCFQFGQLHWVFRQRLIA